MKRKICLLLQATAALVLGLLIYLLFRKGTVIHRMIPAHFAGIWAEAEFPLDIVVKYYLCDMLWGFALAICLCMVIPMRWAVLVAVCFGCTWELLQFVGLISGTGDILDCIVYLIGASSTMIINKKVR